MTLTIEFGWWLAPALVTVAAFGWYAIWSIQQPASSGYGAIGDGLAHALLLSIAIIASLVAWLIWAVLA
jgi:hypothetical protein